MNDQGKRDDDAVDHASTALTTLAAHEQPGDDPFSAASRNYNDLKGKYGEAMEHMRTVILENERLLLRCERLESEMESKEANLMAMAGQLQKSRDFHQKRANILEGKIDVVAHALMAIIKTPKTPEEIEAADPTVVDPVSPEDIEKLRGIIERTTPLVEIDKATGTNG